MFRAEHGMRFGLWRQKARLLESVRVLVEGGSVTDAALESGYSSVSAYIAAFKQTFGCTPGAMEPGRLRLAESAAVPRPPDRERLLQVMTRGQPLAGHGRPTFLPDRQHVEQPADRPRSLHSASTGHAIFLFRSASSCLKSIDAPAR